MSELRVLIAGSRDWQDEKIIHTILNGLRLNYGKMVVIEGCANGADDIAHNWKTDTNDIEHEHYPALWDEHDLDGTSFLPCPDTHTHDMPICKVAGPRRNRQMLNDGKPQVVFCFSDDIKNSKGTRDMRNIAKAAGIPTYVISRA